MDLKDIAWMAGYLEGEGCFQYSGRSPNIAITTTDYDVAERSANLLKSKVGERKTLYGKLGKKRQFSVKKSGHAAVGWMMTVYSLMGERRKSKIRDVIAQFRSCQVQNQKRTRCKHGHTFDAIYTDPKGWTRRRCVVCHRAAGRKKTAAYRARLKARQEVA